MKKLTLGLMVVIRTPAKQHYLISLPALVSAVGNWAGVTVERKEGAFTTDHRSRW